VRKSAIVLLTFSGVLSARLNDDALKMLHDPGGWEYVKMSNGETGFQTTHVCFDGTPHRDECSGNMLLRSDNTFLISVRIHGQVFNRRGKYDLKETQLAFYDEFGNLDGPYSVDLNTQTKALVLSMPQVRIELELEKEYKKAQSAKKKAHTP
jgi:hypothetical protein